MGTNPDQRLLGNFDGRPDLVTVNAGSNDLTLISGFNGPDPLTTRSPPAASTRTTAFAFAPATASTTWWSATAAMAFWLCSKGAGRPEPHVGQTEPNLPSPTALAFSALTGGQVQFYAATAGHEAATLVALS